MITNAGRDIFSAVVLLGLSASGCSLLSEDDSSNGGGNGERVAAVEVSPIERRPLDLQRTFSGALKAESKLLVAPKVAGRIDRLEVDLADPVERGQIVVMLDDEEFVQAVEQAEAAEAVAKANLVQAENALEISRREYQRIVELREDGIASDSQYDLAQADLMQKEAQLKVAQAEVRRAAAVLESARIRLGYTQVKADWPEGDAQRFVAERYVDEGETISANEPMFLIVQLDPIVAVIQVTERDYGQLHRGLEARFHTDAFPGKSFEGHVERIAPVFRESSRQAQVELTLANPEFELKPGMFIRATVILDHVEEAVAVPEAALTKRGGVMGVFLVDESGGRVSWQPVETGIRSQGWVQLLNENLTGRVVTLGQHLIDDGSSITIAGTFESQPAL